ncbi:MAG TPA: transglycosylase domain-containing protein [Candidatus Limnocylindrales bacterium]
MGGIIWRLPSLLRTGLIGGMIIALLGLPVAFVMGNAVKAGNEAFQAIPSELTESPSGQTSYVYAADGKTLLTMFYEEHRRYIPLSEMPPLLYQAVIAAEDTRFFHHNGVDLPGLVRAFLANQRAGGVEQGASTLTMQYVRMALRDGARSPDDVLEATEQTPARKLREVRVAMELEQRLSKEEILERYLNTAYFGHRAYGAYAAAQIYFTKAPKDLTLTQAALLAGLVKAPTDYDPAGQDATAALARRDWVLDRMARQKYVTPEQAAQAKVESLDLKVTDPPNDCTGVTQEVNNYGYFCEFFKSWWIRQPMFGSNPHERMDTLRRGGYQITTSIDPHINSVGKNAVFSQQAQNTAFALGVVAIEPGTGRVKAMTVNRTFSVDQARNGANTDPGKRGKIPGNYPNTVNALLGGGDLPGYQAGSTFKFFTMLAALDAGMPLTTSYHAPKQLVSQYPGTPGESSTCGGRWCPVNASDAMTGNQTMWSGFGKSVNTYFVQLEQAVGSQNAVKMAERLGLRWRSETDKAIAENPQRAALWGAFTLGVADTTPLEMANAVATVAAEGVYCEPIPVVSIIGPDGTDRADATNPRCHQELPVHVARAATDAARCVTGFKAAGGNCGDWSTAGGVAAAVGRPVAGKTGTTDSTRSAWFVGYTPQLAAASFMADPDFPFNNVGDGNSQKPVQSVVAVLRDGLAGQPVLNFNYP